MQEELFYIYMLNSICWSRQNAFCYSRGALPRDTTLQFPGLKDSEATAFHWTGYMHTQISPLS